MKRARRPELIPYTPNDWTPHQAQCHMANDLDEAFHAASCLAGGWYRRSVDICVRVTADNDEEYRVVPSEHLPPEGFSKCYRVERLGDGQ